MASELAGPHRRGGRHRTDTAPSPGRATEHRHLLCLACGRLARPDRFRAAVAPGYAPAAKIQRVGGYKSIAWRGDAFSEADRRLIVAALRSALARL